VDIPNILKGYRADGLPCKIKTPIMFKKEKSRP
jgi:hypothetical protein